MKHVHMIGIGGTGLSAIARILLEKGYTVSGSDRYASPLFKEISAAGAKTYLGHAAENIVGAHMVLRSSAIPDDNPEVLAAAASGIPVLKRAEFLSELTEEKETLAIAGSHGKTTTTAMLAWILDQLGMDPSFIVGGVVKQLGCNARSGTGAYFVIEADEYDFMFLGLSPKIAVITNIEHDHYDCFPTDNDYRKAFHDFLRKVRPDGIALYCVDDPQTRSLLQAKTLQDIKCLGYGIGDDADYQATMISTHDKTTKFTLTYRHLEDSTQKLGDVTLITPGLHNVRNAAAALAVVHQLGLSLPKAIEALSSFTGAGRRFEILGKANDITIIDDYGHHPTEIAATLSAARSCYPGHRIWAIWQPHTFTRTQSLEDDFVHALSLADRVVILKIYAAREKDPGYSAEKLAAACEGRKAVYIPGFDSATHYLLETLSPGDIAIVFSAGDATEISQSVLDGLRQEEIANNPTAQSVKLPMEKLRKTFGKRLHENASMSQFTTAHAGGLVPALIEIYTLDELVETAQALWEDEIPFMTLGSGSNILVSDHGVNRIILLNRANNFLIDAKADSPLVTADSGAILGTIARQTALRGLSGLEWAAPVPGTVGGAVYGNAGAHGSDMESSLIMAKILHKSKGIQDWTVEELAYQYRSSILKRENLPVVVLSATFNVTKTSREEAWQKIKTYQAHRKETQPPGASMGSMFKNPMGDYAGRLIEAAGLKGYRIGNAMISPIHANFIINLEGASAQEIFQLMRIAQRSVEEKFGIHLEPEIELIGEFIDG